MNTIRIFFLLLIAFAAQAQNYPDPVITVNNTTKEVTVTVKREAGMKEPILTLDGFEDPCGTFFYVKNDSQFVASFKLIYATLEPDTIKIEANKFLQTGGTVNDVGANSANIGAVVETSGVVGFYNVGDWLKYSVNLTGKSKIRFDYSYALTATDRKLEVRLGSVTGQVISEMPAQPTGNWNTFLEKTLDINLDTTAIGPIDLFFVISGPAGASNYWGNLTGEIWFY